MLTDYYSLPLGASQMQCGPKQVPFPRVTSKDPLPDQMEAAYTALYYHLFLPERKYSGFLLSDLSIVFHFTCIIGQAFYYTTNSFRPIIGWWLKAVCKQTRETPGPGLGSDERADQLYFSFPTSNFHQLCEMRILSSARS